MPLAGGTKLGQYEIIAPIGAGGMGEVYRARDPQLGRDVAIKVLPASFSRDPDRLRRFEQEARAAAALNHPNILAVYHFGSHEGSPYLVSELLEGCTLREQLLRGPMLVRKAVDYATQTAHGLAAAHEKGIVHRDLKPENLFLTKDGRIKILDFGLAKLISQPHPSDPATPTLTEGTEPGVVLGTVGYMSPEQVRGQAANDRADIFALGAILYEMLTGKRAFHKPTHAETMSAILNEEPTSVSQTASIPPALQKVVQRCLEKNPQQRFHSASDLAFALEALSDSGSAASGVLAVTKSPASWGWIAVVTVAMAILAALAVWLTRPPAIPVVESVTQLTNDGEPKEGVQNGGTLATDGTRIYLNEGLSGSMKIVQVSVSGGDTAQVATQLASPMVAGLAKDGSALLLLTSPQGSLWFLPLPAGTARPLGSIVATSASLFPDGRLVYSLGSAIYAADKDGTNPHKLAEIPRLNTGAPQVSPDGRRVVFSSFSAALSLRWGPMYEMAADGTGLHQILQGGQEGLPSDICCALWTPDGKHLLFQARSQGRWDLWTLPAEKSFGQTSTKPMRLTNGPLSYTLGAISPDGKQIFAAGAKGRGELVRYDETSHQLVPYLDGISAFDTTFSRDGKWVAYVSYPDHTLWRSRSDGSEKLQLTYPPQSALYPRISPDGTKVSFSTLEADAYVVGINGGAPRKISDNAVAPDWSPDANFLVVTSADLSKTYGESGYFESRILDLRTGAVSVVPDSKDTIGPWFLTQDTIVFAADGSTKFVLHDLKSRKSSELARFPDYMPAWEPSVDGKYLYCTTAGTEPKVYRIRISDHRVETVTSLKNLRVVDDPFESVEIGVAPDGSALFTRDNRYAGNLRTLGEVAVMNIAVDSAERSTDALG